MLNYQRVDEDGGKPRDESRENDGYDGYLEICLEKCCFFFNGI